MSAILQHPIVSGCPQLLATHELWALLGQLGSVRDPRLSALARYAQRVVGIESLALASGVDLQRLILALQALALQGDLQRAVACRQRRLAARPGSCLDTAVAALLAQAQRLRLQGAGFDVWLQAWQQLGIALGESDDESPLARAATPSRAP